MSTLYPQDGDLIVFLEPEDKNWFKAYTTEHIRDALAAETPARPDRIEELERRVRELEARPLPLITYPVAPQWPLPQPYSFPSGAGTVPFRDSGWTITYNNASDRTNRDVE